MRRFLSIFLLFLFLFGALVPGQAQEELTKFPVLWKHFIQHQKQTGLTFLQYLDLHYGSGFAKHNPAHDHSELPMKSGDNHLHTPAPVDLPKPLELVLQIPPTTKQSIIFKDQSAPQSFLSDIWQPPRSC